MAQLKVTWKDGSKEEIIDAIDGMTAAEYKQMRFGSPASEVDVVEVKAEKPAAKAKKAAE